MKTIEAFAEAHHGLICRREAERLGISRNALDHEIRKGRLERIGRSVYRIPGSVPTWHQRLLAAVWAAGADACASHRSAAALQPLPGFPAGPIDVCRPRHASRSGQRATMWETSYLPSHHVTEIDGIPATAPGRTLLDICGLVHPGRADWALEHALNAKLVTYEGMEIVLAESARQGRHGITVLRSLLAERGAGYVPTESALEALVVTVLTAAGLPEPERQVVLGNRERFIGRVDFLYREAKLVIEADGRQHGGWLAQQDDHRRDALLRAAGYTVIRVDWRMLTREPELFVAAVRAELARARRISA